MIYIKNTTGHDIYDWQSQFTFLNNEILTEREFQIFMPLSKPQDFTRINIPKSKTTRYFGVRYECHH
jgi:hypothetical protein